MGLWGSGRAAPCLNYLNYLLPWILPSSALPIPLHYNTKVDISKLVLHMSRWAGLSSVPKGGRLHSQTAWVQTWVMPLLFAVRTWGIWLPFLGLSFLICKIRISSISISQNYCEDEMHHSLWSARPLPGLQKSSVMLAVIRMGMMMSSSPLLELVVFETWSNILFIFLSPELPKHWAQNKCSQNAYGINEWLPL